MSQVYSDYINRRLDGYNASPTMFDINDFRKYYKGVVEGL